MTENLLGILSLLAVMAGGAAALYALARFVGLGRCSTCRGAIPPWNAYCWAHSPDNPNREE